MVRLLSVVLTASLTSVAAFLHSPRLGGVRPVRLPGALQCYLSPQRTLWTSPQCQRTLELDWTAPVVLARRSFLSTRLVFGMVLRVKLLLAALARSMVRARAQQRGRVMDVPYPRPLQSLALTVGQEHFVQDKYGRVAQIRKPRRQSPSQRSGWELMNEGIF